MPRSEKTEQAARKARRPRSDERAIWLIQNICERAGSPDLIPEHSPLRKITEKRDTPALFDWLTIQISYQGISDRVADAYIRKHGSITWNKIEAAVRRKPECPKLKSYWHFHKCGYSKSERTCSYPDHFGRCPVPRARLRSGRLNQSAYSLFFFIRDVADGDLIAWIDKRLSDSPVKGTTAIIAALRGIYGVADKLLLMVLATLFLSAGPARQSWEDAGTNMIVVDSLVHNWLLRSGLITRLGRGHSYGSACYSPGGCVSIVRRLSRYVDATDYNEKYPRYFPRFVQHAIWRYCAQDHLNLCNGNRIDDWSRCRDRHCILFRGCARQKLI